MKEDFVTYDLAVKLKEKGFREKCKKHCYPNSQDWFISSMPECDNFSNYLDIPTIYQVFKWLIEKKNIFVAVNICWCFEDEEHPFFEVKEPIFKGYYSSVYFLKDLAKQDTCKSNNYDSFEQAALAGIEYVINNLI